MEDFSLALLEDGQALESLHGSWGRLTSMRDSGCGSGVQFRGHPASRFDWGFALSGSREA